MELHSHHITASDSTDFASSLQHQTGLFCFCFHAFHWILSSLQSPLHLHFIRGRLQSPLHLHLIRKKRTRRAGSGARVRSTRSAGVHMPTTSAVSMPWSLPWLPSIPTRNWFLLVSWSLDSGLPTWHKMLVIVSTVKFAGSYSYSTVLHCSLWSVNMWNPAMIAVICVWITMH
jgi:hypothetical protein